MSASPSTGRPLRGASASRKLSRSAAAPPCPPCRPMVGPHARSRRHCLQWPGLRGDPWQGQPLPPTSRGASDRRFIPPRLQEGARARGASTWKGSPRCRSSAAKYDRATCAWAASILRGQGRGELDWHAARVPGGGAGGAAIQRLRSLLRAAQASRASFAARRSALSAPSTSRAPASSAGGTAAPHLRQAAPPLAGTRWCGAQARPQLVAQGPAHESPPAARAHRCEAAARARSVRLRRQIRRH